VFSDSNSAIFAFVVHDGTYLVDFAVKHHSWDSEHSMSQSITDFVVSETAKYEREHLSNFVGVGLPQRLLDRSPSLCSRLWAKLDIIPITPDSDGAQDTESLQRQTQYESKSVEEQADSMARKCIMSVLLFAGGLDDHF
jgi:alpha,alpha-trehalose phosphorylase (configuration-retaining)